MLETWNSFFCEIVSLSLCRVCASTPVTFPLLATWQSAGSGIIALQRALEFASNSCCVVQTSIDFFPHFSDVAIIHKHQTLRSSGGTRKLSEKSLFKLWNVFISLEIEKLERKKKNGKWKWPFHEIEIDRRQQRAWNYTTAQRCQFV